MAAIVLLFAGMARSYKNVAPLTQEPEKQTQGALLQVVRDVRIRGLIGTQIARASQLPFQHSQLRRRFSELRSICQRNSRVSSGSGSTVVLAGSPRRR
jgi:hypothetical protein